MRAKPSQEELFKKFQEIQTIISSPVFTREKKECLQISRDFYKFLLLWRFYPKEKFQLWQQVVQKADEHTLLEAGVSLIEEEIELIDTLE